jgi:hypothetical protein
MVITLPGGRQQSGVETKKDVVRFLARQVAAISIERPGHRDTNRPEI